MNEPTPGQSPIAIDRVERTRGEGDHVRLRLAGHWLAAERELELDALLVVQLHGHRHRFPAVRAHRDDSSPGSWVASFTIPDWAVPAESGQAALWVGNAAVPVPPPGTIVRAAELTRPEPVAAVPPIGQPEPAERELRAAPVPAEAPEAMEDDHLTAGRGGPLADLLFKETVSALRSELEQRAGEGARLHAELADARSELELRTGSLGELQATNRELRDELSQLIDAVARQRADTDRHLDMARAERDTAVGELAGARSILQAAQAERDAAKSERDGLGAELARLRAEHEALQRSRDDRAGDAAALNERLAVALASERRRAHEAASSREQLVGAQISRDAAISEAGGLRAELERLGSELAVVREQAGARSGDLGEAQRLLADARALTQQLREGGDG